MADTASSKQPGRRKSASRRPAEAVQAEDKAAEPCETVVSGTAEDNKAQGGRRHAAAAQPPPAVRSTRTGRAGDGGMEECAGGGLVGEAQRSGAMAAMPAHSPPAQAKDKEAAFREIMRKQVSRIALTIKHTDVPKEELRDFLAPLCHYVRVGHELHQEHVPERPDDHLHAYLQLSAQKRLGEVYKLVQDKFDKRFYGRPDARQLPSNTDAAKWNNYCKKGGDYIDHGELRIGGPARQQGAQDTAPYHEFLRIAATKGVEAAMAYASEELVEQYCTRYSALREAAESKKATHTKYDLPSMKAKDVTLRPWQKAWLPRVMDRRPVARDIHWVWGSPGKGKSFAHDYLAANHPHGCFNAGNRCCLDNLVYNYDEEGVVLWDFPMNFDWDNMALAAAAAIEKFSDFGTSLRSLKYKGKSCYARGHVVVFANRPPIIQLAHREIKEFHIDDYVPPALHFKEAAACVPGVPQAAPEPAPEESAPAEDKEGASAEAQPPKKPRGRPKKPQPTGEAVFKTRSELVREACEPCMDLEGGSAGPKAPHLKKSPPQAPPEALPEGGLPKAKNLGRSTPCGSDASTRATSADTNAASEATTPRGRILNTEVAT